MEDEHDILAEKFANLPKPKHVENNEQADDGEIFEELDPDYELYDRLQDDEINEIIEENSDEIINEPEPEYYRALYSFFEHPKFTNYFHENWTPGQILKKLPNGRSLSNLLFLALEQRNPFAVPKVLKGLFRNFEYI